MEKRFFFIPAILSSFSLIIIYLSLQLDISPPMIVGESMQPRAFPIFLMVINLILIFFLTLQILKDKPKKISIEGMPTWGSMSLFVLFYFLVIYTDLFIGIFFVMFFLSILWGGKLHVAFFTATGAPVFIFFLFDLVLKIRFPRGIITNWYYG